MESGKSRQRMGAENKKVEGGREERIKCDGEILDEDGEYIAQCIYLTSAERQKHRHPRRWTNVPQKIMGRP